MHPQEQEKLLQSGSSFNGMDRRTEYKNKEHQTGLRVLWLTPLRALVEDTTRSLLEVVEDIGLPWTVESRTGDTSGTIKAKQRRKFPSALVTTPESLSLLLSYPETKDMLF